MRNTRKGKLLTLAFKPAGETYIYHVYTPALVYRLDSKGEGSDIPVIALRSSKDQYESFWLVRSVISFGQVDLTEKFGMPLPGTGGRGVAYCVTSDPFTVQYNSRQTAVIACGNDRDAKEILADVLREYS